MTDTKGETMTEIQLPFMGDALSELAQRADDMQQYIMQGDGVLAAEEWRLRELHARAEYKVKLAALEQAQIALDKAKLIHKNAVGDLRDFREMYAATYIPMPDASPLDEAIDRVARESAEMLGGDIVDISAGGE